MDEDFTDDERELLAYMLYSFWERNGQCVELHDADKTKQALIGISNKTGVRIPQLPRNEFDNIEDDHENGRI